MPGKSSERGRGEGSGVAAVRDDAESGRGSSGRAQQTLTVDLHASPVAVSQS